VTVAPDSSTTPVRGRDPLADQDPFSDAPPAYPFPGPRLHSLLADERAPDLVVVHTGDHWFVDQGGHPGEHGSLNGLQSRAPLVLSGRASPPAGSSTASRAPSTSPPRSPTWPAGRRRHGRDAGRPRRPGARHVVGLLWDGAPSAELLRLAQEGELPSVRRLLDRGCALRGGAVAEFPSVTLVNHTCALTGVGPGRHGIVTTPSSTGHRRAGRPQLVGLLAPGRWTGCGPGSGRSSSACRGDDQRLRQRAGRPRRRLQHLRAGARGGLGGTGSLSAMLPAAVDDAVATQQHVSASTDYAWATQVDASGLEQVLGLWRQDVPPASPGGTPRSPTRATTPAGPARRSPGVAAGRRHPARRLARPRRGARAARRHGRAAHRRPRHAGGGPACTGDWDAALEAAGISFRDEAYGFLYLG
jgi:hypothetical protein